LKFYNIHVIKRSRSACGRAYESGGVIIPHPTNLEKFCVALHEVGHIRNGFKGLNYIQEYEAEKFAINEAKKLGLDPSEYEQRAKWYVIMHINRGFRRKLQVKNIPQEIKDWCGIDFNLWEEMKALGKKPWVYRTNETIEFF
jgi:hypothetical protein